MGDVTRNLSFSEAVVSIQFPKLAEQVRLTKLDEIKLSYLFRIYIQPARDYLNSMFHTFKNDEIKVKITSGKRSFKLNFAVGGSEESDHMYTNQSCAVDHYFYRKSGLNLTPIYTMLAKDFYLTQQNYGQLIFYKQTKKVGISFIHLSLPTDKHINYFNVV